MEDDHKMLGAADYLLAMAKTLMNDIETVSYTHLTLPTTPYV